MEITSLVENTSRMDFPVEHGLSLYISLDDGHKILFDMGQRRLFADNAERLGIDLADVDIAVVSHGHYDHGGGLRTFLELNKKAKVYISRHAFEPHYSLRENGLKYIGINPLQIVPTEVVIAIAGGCRKASGGHPVFLHGPQHLGLVMLRHLVDGSKTGFQILQHLFPEGINCRGNSHSLI